MRERRENGKNGIRFEGMKEREDRKRGTSKGIMQKRKENRR